MANWIESQHVVEATYWDYGTSSVHRGHNPLAAAVLATHFGLPGDRTAPGGAPPGLGLSPADSLMVSQNSWA